MQQPLKDNYGREITSLRLSITQKCDLNCFYCHKEGQKKGTEEISLEKIQKIVSVANKLGINKVKITGGEPLQRKDILQIVKICSSYMKEVSLTTNGILLKKFAKQLKENGLKRVNISIDTLNKEKFIKITSKDKLKDVIEGLEIAVKIGLNPVKVNTVVLKGINENEIEDLIKFCKEKNCVLQLIELEARKEDLNNGFYKKYHLNLEKIENDLKKRTIEIQENELHSRKKYFVPSQVEIVKPMHNSEFCKNCKRIRITSDGKLKPCLLSNNGEVDFSEIENEKDLINAFKIAIMNREPYWRD